MGAITIEGFLAILSVFCYMLTKNGEWLILMGLMLIVMMLERTVTAFEDLISLFDNSSDWISVKDAMPPEPLSFGFKEYNVKIAKGNTTTTLEYRGAGVWAEHDRGTTYTVTHWMPLPKPPKEE